MSKISDALRKSEGMIPRLDPVPPPDRSTLPVPEPAPARPVEIVVNPSDLELPLEFVRELGTLRGTIDQLLPGREQRTLLVAGAVAGEGASTVAAAFARLLAEDDRVRVALVDADMRGDSRRLPTVSPDEGLAGVLSGVVGVEQALVGTTAQNLVVLPGGIPADSPLKLGTTENFRPVLDYLRRHFHFVIIDGAPFLDAPEIVSLAGQVDGTIMVVAASRTKREVVLRALDLIEKFQGRVLGAVLNRQQFVIPEFIYRRI